MLGFLGWCHAQLFRLCLWLLRQPLKGIWAFFLSVWMLLGEEFRRWVSLAVSGLLIVLAGKATLNYAPAEAKQPLVLADLLLLAIWALAVRRAAHLTRANNLFRVRNRKAFRDLDANVQEGRREVTGVLARATQNRRVGMVFPSVRQRRADEQAAAEAQRLADAEQTERDRLARADRDRWAEQAGAEHDPFAKQGS